MPCRTDFSRAIVSSKSPVFDRDDMSTAFRLPCVPTLDDVHIFKAPIDLMSFCTLYRDATSNAVALCGLYEGPLDAYLRENPGIRYVFLCLDADGHRKAAAEHLKEKVE